MMGLTPEQGKLLRFIKNYSVGHDGVMPSVAEMTDAVGLRSKSGVVRLLDGLVDRAAIRRIPNRARAIEIVEDGLLEKAREMRTGIDMIESALMGFGDLVELPALFETARDDLGLSLKVSVGQMRRVCTALEECTRIINSDEYLFAKRTP